MSTISGWNWQKNVRLLPHITWPSSPTSHDYHMILTWLSHDPPPQHHMTITWSSSPASHDYHMILTWLSHDPPHQHHMTITWSSSPASHDYHMTLLTDITWLSHNPPSSSDLSSIADLQVVILNTFSSQSEEVRSAASYALGKRIGILTRVKLGEGKY